MSESEGGGDSKFLTGFLIGFVVGVLVCLGVGASFLIVGFRQDSARAAEAMMVAEEARAEAAMQRDRAEQERRRAEKALQELKAAKKKEPGKR